jgi:hypothetical protein
MVATISKLRRDASSGLRIHIHIMPNRRNNTIPMFPITTIQRLRAFAPRTSAPAARETSDLEMPLSAPRGADQVVDLAGAHPCRSASITTANSA